MPPSLPEPALTRDVQVSLPTPIWNEVIGLLLNSVRTMPGRRETAELVSQLIMASINEAWADLEDDICTIRADRITAIDADGHCCECGAEAAAAGFQTWTVENGCFRCSQCSKDVGLLT